MRANRQPPLRVAKPGPVRADVALAVALVAINLTVFRAGQPDPGRLSPWEGTATFALALGSGVPVIWRRTHPVAVSAWVVACYAGLGAVVGLVPPYSAWVVIASVAIYGLERRRSIGLVLAVTCATCLLVVAAELASPGDGASVLLVFITILVALGSVLLRSERGRLDAVRHRATTEERLRIARDLHDLVGHGLSTVAVQSSTARVALDAGDVATARTAMSAVESSSRIAMREMRQMLGVLADMNTSEAGAGGTAAGEGAAQVSSEADLPAPALNDVAALVENVRAAGVAVTLEEHGELGDVPSDTQLCAYRVIQEGLTNAVKHAPGAMVHVRVVATDGLLRAAVESSGGAQSPVGEHGGGLGLSGLRTRVAAASGELQAGRTPQGWLVEARLPLQDGQSR